MMVHRIPPEGPAELPNIKNRKQHDDGAGGGTVEAYPEQTAKRTPQRGAYLHKGPEELYEQFGFVRDRTIAKWRWVKPADVSAASPVRPE